jgi:hypothetical protein
MHRIALAIVAMLVALTLAAPAHATLNACTAAKKLCVAKKTAALLKCHSKNEKPPAGLDPVKFAACLQKAKDKFDGGAHPAKGCFAKLEAKFGPGGCVTAGDTAALETKVDDYVDDVICALDPGAGTCPAIPTPIPTATPSCAAIGQSCALASQCCSQSCMGGTCVPSCTNGMQDGTETDVDCGGSCSPCNLGQGCLSAGDCYPNTQCSTGQCTCGPGQLDCNGNSVDGCEVNPTNNASNCGACNVVCSLPNTMAVCAMSQCQVGPCSAGYGNCNGLTVDGCEVYTAGDNNNCGSCGLICPNPQNCINSVCQ